MVARCAYAPLFSDFHFVKSRASLESQRRGFFVPEESPTPPRDMEPDDMKKSGIGKKRCIALAAAVLAFFGDATAAWAGTETINGVTWSFSAYDGCARVSRASGAGDDLVIPGSLGGYPVTDSQSFD